MSRGLGKIERELLRQVTRLDRFGKRRPVTHISSWSLARALNYPIGQRLPEWSPTMAQSKAVTRALHSFCRKFPQYALTGGKGRQRLYLYEPGDPVSAMWMQLTLDGAASSLA